MPRGRRSATSTDGLASLRKQAGALMKRLRQAGQHQLAAIERELTKLNRQRHLLQNEISSMLGGASPARAGRGRRARVNWDGVFKRLPKGSFQAKDVHKLVPGGVAPGTLSQRLTGWVKAKKLKRTGSRRGTRYTKAA
jgi:hypothetical protein